MGRGDKRGWLWLTAIWILAAGLIYLSTYSNYFQSLFRYLTA
jgi:hypothetical protein